MGYTPRTYEALGQLLSAVAGGWATPRRAFVCTRTSTQAGCLPRKEAPGCGQDGGYWYRDYLGPSVCAECYNPAIGQWRALPGMSVEHRVLCTAAQHASMSLYVSTLGRSNGTAIGVPRWRVRTVHPTVARCPDMSVQRHSCVSIMCIDLHGWGFVCRGRM